MQSNIENIKELFATFMRIKANKPQQEFEVFAKVKDEVINNGTVTSR